MIHVESGKLRLTRRGFLANGLSLAALSASWLKARASSDPVAARTLTIQQGCVDAARKGAAYVPEAGILTVYPLQLPEGARLVGKQGKTILRSVGDMPVLVGKNLRSALVETIVFHGNNARPADPLSGLLYFEDVEQFQLHGLEIAGAGGVGIFNSGSGGEVFGCSLHDIGEAGYHSLDGRGVEFGRSGDGNRVHNCGNAGVRIWTSAAWKLDGSRVRNNEISAIRADGGGDGQNGNGVNIFRAADVVVENNTIDNCAFSAVRNNSGKDFVARGNRCSNSGERAMYAEFDFKNATFENNTITSSAAGLSLTNFDRKRNVGCGGRAVGNQISHLLDKAPDSDWAADPAANAAKVGIEAEGDILVEGNTIVGPLRIGIECGFGAALRAVICRDNRISGADYGIAFTALAPAGPSTNISNNHIVDAVKARIVATQYGEVLGGDLFGRASGIPAVYLGVNFSE